MKKIVAFLLTLGFVVTFTPSVFAGIRYTGKNPVWKCLKVPKNAKGDALSCGSKEAGCSGQGVAGHRVKLTMSGLNGGAEVFLVGCIGTETGNSICTTGDQTADNTIYGDWKNGVLAKPSTNLADLTKTYKYEFQGLFKKDGLTQVKPPSPVMPEPSGELTKANEWYEWQDFTPVAHRRKWLTLQYADPKKAPIGGAGGNQQGTFDFATAISSCASINWDPYGTVFDAKTLEPVPGALVTLLMKKGEVFSPMTTDDMLGGDIYNPQTTVKDGMFEYVVPDGDYKLATVPTFVTNLTLIDPNYTKAYSEIYAGEVIQQRGFIQHRDIAVPTKNTNNPPAIMNFFYMSSPFGVVTFDGNVTHPLTKLHIKTSKVSSANPSEKTPYRTLGEFQADKRGAFKFDVDQSVFEKTPEYIEVISGLELEKVDLVNAQVKGVKVVVPLEPIPQYLEGLAYDSAGKPMANVEVAIKIPHSQAPYYETTTDATGKLMVTSDHLPASTYTLVYTTTTGTEVEVKPVDFVAKNQAYFASNNVSPWVGKNSDGTVAPTGQKALENARLNASRNERSSLNNTTPKGNAPTPIPAANSQAMNQIVVLLTVIVLLVIGVVGIVLFLKKKQSEGSHMI